MAAVADRGAESASKASAPYRPRPLNDTELSAADVELCRVLEIEAETAAKLLRRRQSAGPINGCYFTSLVEFVRALLVSHYQQAGFGPQVTWLSQRVHPAARDYDAAGQRAKQREHERKRLEQDVAAGKVRPRKPAD